MEEGRTMILMYEAPGLGAFLFSCEESLLLNILC